MNPALRFRPLVDADLPMLHGWLNEPGVIRWWEGDDVSWEAVVRDYGSSAARTIEHWVSVYAAREVGWLQCYAAADHATDPEVQQWLMLGVEPTAAGIDYLVGSPADRGRGLGAAMIRAFVAEVVFGHHPDWTQVCAAPLVANAASCRALEKAGFEPLGVFESRHGPCQLMTAARGLLAAS